MFEYYSNMKNFEKLNESCLNITNAKICAWNRKIWLNDVMCGPGVLPVWAGSLGVWAWRLAVWAGSLACMGRETCCVGWESCLCGPGVLVCGL